MKKGDLLPFYFGALGSAERLVLEREMLTDTALLLDYLDLKRELEGAPEISGIPPFARLAALQGALTALA